jgi:hypothetical protein
MWPARNAFVSPNQSSYFFIKILSLAANGYPSGKYGDQKFHQAENNLGGEGLISELSKFLG